MRLFRTGLIVALITAPLAASAQDLPTAYCEPGFVAKWLANQATTIPLLPKKPCWMRTNTGDYVCYKDGCVRAHVYFG